MQTSDILNSRHKTLGLASYTATAYAIIVLIAICHTAAAESADLGASDLPVESDNAYEWLAYNIPVYRVESVSLAEALDVALETLKRVAGEKGKSGPIGLLVYDPPMGAASPRITAKLENVSFGRLLSYLQDMAKNEVRLRIQSEAIHCFVRPVRSPMASSVVMALSKRTLLAMGIAEPLDKRIDLRAWFSARGVRMSERSFAAYFSDAGILSISNESEELTLMEAIILLYQRERTVVKHGEQGQMKAE